MLQFYDIPNHKASLKVGKAVMLLRNLNPHLHIYRRKFAFIIEKNIFSERLYSVVRCVNFYEGFYFLFDNTETNIYELLL